MLKRCGVARLTKDACQLTIPKRFPQRMQCPDVAQRQSRLKFNLRPLGGTSFGTKQRVEDGIDLATPCVST